MHEQTYHAMYSREFLFGRWLWILTIAIIQERTFTLKQPFPTRTCEGQYESETQSPMLFPLFSSLTCHFVRLAGIIAPVLQKCLVIAKVMSTWQKSSKSHIVTAPFLPFSSIHRHFPSPPSPSPPFLSSHIFIYLFAYFKWWIPAPGFHGPRPAPVSPGCLPIRSVTEAVCKGMIHSAGYLTLPTSRPLSLSLFHSLSCSLYAESFVNVLEPLLNQ